jgi:uncharacterized cupin superfamily protein
MFSIGEAAMVYKRNLGEMKWTEMGHGERFFHRRKTLTPMGEPYIPKLGISLYKLETGKRAFPFHTHFANDEAILITKGAGTLRYGAEEMTLKEGDYIHLPASSGIAHQVINTSDADLEYFCLSSMILPEVVTYPDSNKIGAATYAVGEDGKAHSRKFSVKRYETVDYWDGEEPE